MKKSFHQKITRACPGLLFVVVATCLLSENSWSELKMAAAIPEKKQAAQPSPAPIIERAEPAKADDSIDPNILLAFKRIYILPIEDNVEGALRAPIEAAYKEIFEKNKRFELVSKKEDSDTSLKFSIEKKTSGIDITIETSLTLTSEVFATDKTSISPLAMENDIRNKSKELLKTTLKHIPFYGTISGREGDEVTLDIGFANGLKKGDIVQISRIGLIKRHPLLKNILDVEVVPIGSVEVSNIEDTISFGKVTQQFEGETIKRYHKITSVEFRKPDEKKSEAEKKAAKNSGVKVKEEGENGPRKIGLVGLGLFLGGFSSSTSTSGGSQNFSGSSFSPGARLNGELWFTKNWFADLNLSYSTMSIRQNDDTSPSTSDFEGVTSSTRAFGFGAGYRFLPDDSIWGPQLALKVGYYNFKWDTSTLPANLMGSKTYGGLSVGAMGSMPIVSYDQGATLGLNLLLFPSLTEEGYTTGADPSATVISFYVGGYYFITRDIAFRGSLVFEIFTASFGEGSSKASTSQKQYGVLPSIVYYF